MSSYGEIRSVFAVPFGDRVADAARAGVRTVMNIGRAFAHRRELALLGSLNDHMLKDIGIDRSDLRDAASQPLWADPTQILVSRSVERRAAHLLRSRAAARRMPD
ncbi:DUF1127 domain-containing protein [Azorhizobium sp. AG788]|uniref:DUF1127 domain-containing protein n=1 Tax=Azorhizobium sp. AG788 TaxID=2183897 RepID=UPI0031394E73